MKTTKFDKVIMGLPLWGRLIDLGSGECEVLRRVHKLRPDLELYALDSNPCARRNVPEYAKFIEESIEDCNLVKYNFFDCPISYYYCCIIEQSKRQFLDFSYKLKRC
jgi:hypothetical protein